MQCGEAPLPVRFQALAADDAKASQQELYGDCNNEQPGKAHVDLAHHHQLPPAAALSEDFDRSSSRASRTRRRSIESGLLSNTRSRPASFPSPELTARTTLA